MKAATPRTQLGRYIGVAPFDHLTAAATAILEYADLLDAASNDRPGMWPFADDLWQWVCQLIVSDQMALAIRMLTVARSQLTSTPVEPEPDEAQPS